MIRVSKRQPNISQNRGGDLETVGNIFKLSFKRKEYFRINFTYISYTGI